MYVYLHRFVAFHDIIFTFSPPSLQGGIFFLKENYSLNTTWCRPAQRALQVKHEVRKMKIRERETSFEA
ncbi:hypothetical protein QVD17_11179 [Tagetes erecta]|uniref:Uncharacterized protein n=1 Tax=Tagetes erecta TaxID=13708 RepID=A0AAD8L4T1_TARER|nr:hypothetical protein QVD17_11179 [Tagetes erecta]